VTRGPTKRHQRKALKEVAGPTLFFKTVERRRGLEGKEKRACGEKGEVETLEYEKVKTHTFLFPQNSHEKSRKRKDRVGKTP